MKSLITTLFLVILTLIAGAEPLTLPLTPTTPSKGSLPTGLNVVTSMKEGIVVIELNDGKLKYGVHNILIKKGDVTLTRPRLKLEVSLEKAKAITSKNPFKVIDFTHDGTPYKIELIKSNSSLPDVVIDKR